MRLRGPGATLMMRGIVAEARHTRNALEGSTKETPQRR
jgi:hypothetical protein